VKAIVDSVAIALWTTILPSNLTLRTAKRLQRRGTVLNRFGFTNRNHGDVPVRAFQ
jgi:hypothetical protein